MDPIDFHSTGGNKYYRSPSTVWFGNHRDLKLESEEMMTELS